MARHELGDETNEAVVVKGEAGAEDMDGNYVVVEVIQEDAEEMYEDEDSNIEYEEEHEEMEEIVEESDNFTLTESKNKNFIQFLFLSKTVPCRH